MNYAILIDKMIEYFCGDSKRIQHFLKVYSFAETIGKLENLDEGLLHILKTAAIVHDIGIKASEEKYNSSAGNLQEKEGPPIAEKMLTDLHFDSDTIERVSWLIAHHHTYHSITSIDHQILVEADFLVNMCEDQMSHNSVQSICDNIFQTAAGKRICMNLFALGNIADSDTSGTIDGINTADTTKETKENEALKQPSLTPEKRVSNKISTFKEAALSPAYIVSEKCIGCGTCVDVCPAQCIESRRTPVYIRQEDCLHCGSCADVCDRCAIIQISDKKK